MSDANKLTLARAIHGTPHATRDSFSPSTWAGVERAWAWVEKRYERDGDEESWSCRWCHTGPFTHDTGPDGWDAHWKSCKKSPRNEPPQDQPMKQEAKMWTFSEKTPPWTEAQREAASPDGKPVQILHADGSLTLMDGTYWKKNHGGQWVQEPAPSPAPAGVAPWPKRYWCPDGTWRGRVEGPMTGNACEWPDVDAALRTRDERIAEQAATIATLTKERDELVRLLQRSLSRESSTFDELTSSRAERDAALARVAELEREGDVRRITREDAVRLWQRLPNSTWNELTDALRAIGFEVEA